MWVDVQQNTDDWFALRIGKSTSSNFDKIMANEGEAFGVPAQEYAQKIALEMVTGLIDESKSYSNQFMERGHELEPVAIEMYEIQTFNEVTNGGFNDVDWLGDSPDGNIGQDGCLEVKSVIPNTQWKRLKREGIDGSYKWQICGHIWLGNKQWCDFVSFCPEMPINKQLYIYRVNRDEDMISRLESRLNDFKKLIDSNVDILNN